MDEVIPPPALAMVLANYREAIRRKKTVTWEETSDYPSGRKVSLQSSQAQPGLWRASAKADELGLYRATDGALNAVAASGPLNPKEVADMRATGKILAPAARASGGSVRWLTDSGVPQIRRVNPGHAAAGGGWIKGA